MGVLNWFKTRTKLVQRIQELERAQVVITQPVSGQVFIARSDGVARYTQTPSGFVACH